jgi:hypothetical protein
MAIPRNVLQAKESLSAQLLSTTQGGSLVIHHFTNDLAVAVAMAAPATNVHAVGVGRKIVAGKVTNTLAVRIYVAQKLAASLLSAADLLPTTVNSVPTDIIESPPAFLAVSDVVAPVTTVLCTDDRKKRQRPLVAGISTAHFSVTAGTIGYFCRSTRAGDDPTMIYVLSNNHVFANVSQAAIGDDLYQPGPADGGTANERIARLSRFGNLDLSGINSNLFDAAIGELLPGINYRARICGIGKVTGVTQALEGMIVRKHGRTTGYTRGQVSDESYDAIVGMDHANPNVTAKFSNQMRIDRIRPYPAIGLGGDSGSLVVGTPKAQAVGLYFAYGIANHIANVLTGLEIQLV